MTSWGEFAIRSKATIYHAFLKSSISTYKFFRLINIHFWKDIFNVIIREFDKRSKKLFSLLMIIPRRFVTFSRGYVLILKKERLTLITFWNVRVDYTVLRFSNTATVKLQTNSYMTKNCTNAVKPQFRGFTLGDNWVRTNFVPWL